MDISDKLFIVAKSIAKKAGKELIKRSHMPHQLTWSDSSFEGYRSVKSKIDIEIEKLIIEEIHKKFPDHAILSEESGFHSAKNNSEFTWIIDPLHDTVAFVRGNQPEFSVTVAVAFRNETICSAVYQPILKKLYSAKLHGGAFLNNEKIHVSKIGNIENVNLSIQHNAIKYGEFDTLIGLIKKVKKMYALGSAMFPELAAGLVDGVISYKQSTYDYAANKLLVEEEGGKVTQIDGTQIPLKFDNERRYTIIATNTILHHTLLKAIF